MQINTNQQIANPILNDKKFWVTLNHFPKFGPIRFKKLENFFSSLEEAFSAPFSALREAGIEKSIVEEFIAFRGGLVPDLIMESLLKENISVTIKTDTDYPSILQELYNPPPILYYRGCLACLDMPGIAVVGSRKCTSYGQMVTEKISTGLVSYGLNIVSGLALGIDTVAHIKCLEANGITIAVVGTGLDRRSFYPSQNLNLADRISEKGVVLSEFPPGMPPLKINFPQRNRLISGLSVGVIVVEASERSGALITAKYALEQDREVFAVPGNIFSLVSKGPNNLIKHGAKPVTELNDILEVFSISNKNGKSLSIIKPEPDTPEEALILECLSVEPISIDEIIRNTALDISVINSTLTIMEVKGMVRNVGSGEYILVA